MQIVLTVIAGPHKGRVFRFDRHDTFLVGRSKNAHFQLPAKDRYFSRIHFMMELNPPACRLIDMGSHNGTFVNGSKVLTAELKDGDQIRAGHTTLSFTVQDLTPESATPFESSKDALPFVPGHKLERELGRGAMGVTYLGRNSDLAHRAIKIVVPSFAGSTEQVEQFLQSARGLTSLEHPRIVRLRDVSACPSGFCFVSDYVPGYSAIDILKRNGPLALKRAVGWVDQLLSALTFAHGLGLVHHDIKPANVLVALVNGKEQVYLADYATARVWQAAPFSGLSVTTAMLELASFMPPELLFNYQESNPLADQYSIAAVFYHILTGAQPLDLPTEPDKRYTSLLRRQCVPIRERRKDVPAALTDAIHKALSRTPTQRFASCADFRQAVLAAV